MKILRPTKLTIADAITIHSDGRTDVNPAYTTEEAAKVFWDLVVATSPFQSRDATLEDAAKVADARARVSRLADKPSQLIHVSMTLAQFEAEAIATAIRALKEGAKP